MIVQTADHRTAAAAISRALGTTPAEREARDHAAALAGFHGPLAKARAEQQEKGA